MSTRSLKGHAALASPREFRRLFPEFAAPSWTAWASIEDAIFGDVPSDPELARRVTGRTTLPTTPVAEFWCIAGRGAGKSRFAARIAAFVACARTYSRVPGESIYVGVFAPDRKQATVTFKYIVGLLRSVPSLAQLIVAETRDSIELANGIIVEVITASVAAPRGRAYVLVIIEEACFLPCDDNADPDRELLRAIRPALARVPGSMLAVISSPYAARGEVHRMWRESFGHDDADRLVVQADTLTLNSAFSRREIARAYAEDPAAAAAEYGGAFRSDVEGFITRAALEAVTIAGRLELPAVPNVAYRAFLDFAGGSGSDSAALAIAHHESGIAVLDCLREARPPFSPEQVCADFAATCKTYGVGLATADRWGGQFPAEQMQKFGVHVQVSEKTKSDLYREALPALNSGRIALLDIPRLHAQLERLERRVARGGKDSIDHGPNGHDDLANVACGVLVLALDGVNAPMSPEVRTLIDASLASRPPFTLPALPGAATQGFDRERDAPGTSVGGFGGNGRGPDAPLFDIGGITRLFGR